jgi:hypothetical protein
MPVGRTPAGGELNAALDVAESPARCSTRPYAGPKLRGEAAVDRDLDDLGVQRVVIPRKGRPGAAGQATSAAARSPSTSSGAPAARPASPASNATTGGGARSPTARPARPPGAAGACSPTTPPRSAPSPSTPNDNAPDPQTPTAERRLPEMDSQPHSTQRTPRPTGPPRPSPPRSKTAIGALTPRRTDIRPPTTSYFFRSK